MITIVLGLLGLLRTRAFQVWQPPQFLALALGTNLCYIAALHYYSYCYYYYY